MKLSERLDHITSDHLRRSENDIVIPDWLDKQNKAVEIIADDNKNGIYLLIEGLFEEREWITSLLMNVE